MTGRHALSCLSAALVLATWLTVRDPTSAQGQKFDKLADADRVELAQRFKRDVWPLLSRGGKEGCVGCHNGKGIVSSLRFSGDADKDFRVLVRDGFFLPDDPGSLL